jgi:putative ABC transport system permease protein
MSRSQRIASTAFASLLANKQRTILMMLGLAVGTAVLSATIVIGQGTSERIMSVVRQHGLDMVMIRAGGEVQIFAPQGDLEIAALFEPDARAIEAEIPNVAQASAVQNQRGINVVFEDRSVVTRAFGVEPSWIEVRSREIAEGEFITDADMAAMGRVAVLGDRVARELFPQGGATESIIRVNNEPYTVKGVFSEVGVGAGGDDFDDRIVIPFTTSARRLVNRPYLEQIVFRVSDIERIPETAEQVRELLRVRHTIAPGTPDDFFVREPEVVEGAALETSTTLFALMIGASAVALIAGGLVIMNLMLIAVSQRGREIGLRRALGARASDITRQFVFEALFVALAGGVIGLILGLAGAWVLAAGGFASVYVTWVPFALAVAACVAIGVAFGVHPARKAAQLNPATTLRGRAI